MTTPRIVAPEEAQEWKDDNYLPPSRPAADLIHTIATEPDRIRAAVVKALRKSNCQLAADAIANGADW